LQFNVFMMMMKWNNRKHVIHEKKWNLIIQKQEIKATKKNLHSLLCTKKRKKRYFFHFLIVSQSLSHTKWKVFKDKQHKTMTVLCSFSLRFSSLLHWTTRRFKNDMKEAKMQQNKNWTPYNSSSYIVLNKIYRQTTTKTTTTWYCIALFHSS
jgi:hypothetical protein